MHGLISPSAFWIAARRLLSLRFVVAALIMLVCLEAVARVSPWVVGKQVHQRLLYSQRICERECSNKGRRLTWAANARGARGALYTGQPVRIAVLGSSTSADTLLDQSELWSERLRQHLGVSAVHVDNYARDGAADPESVTILEHLRETGPHYDAVLLMTHLATPDSPARHTQGAAFRFWRDWEPRGRTLEFPGLLARRMRVQIQQEPRTQAVWRAVRRPPAPAPRTGPRPLDPANRELRRLGKVRLVEYHYVLAEGEESDIRRRARRLVEAAQAVGDHVWMIRQPVAHDENEAPGVSQRWMSLYPVPGRSDVYIDNRSFAEGFRLGSGIMADEAKRAGAGVIDLDSAMRPLLASRDDLFEDKWHFSPAGADLAARFIAQAVQDDLGVDAPLDATAAEPADRD